MTTLHPSARAHIYTSSLSEKYIRECLSSGLSEDCCCAPVSPFYECVLMGCKCVIRGREKQCQCGEDQSEFHWVWDPASTVSMTQLKEDGREAVFHSSVSSGTAAIRGTEIMKDGQYYWEVKMITPVYGTDMMVGVCTPHMVLDKHMRVYISLLGADVESWGLSYKGTIHHQGASQRYMPNALIRQGSIIGVHLDTWRGKLAFYLNGQPLGVAFEGLRGKELYPVISSTSARSGMKLITTSHFPTSLAFMCAQTLRRHVHHSQHVLDAVSMPPGLSSFLRRHLNWVLRAHSLPERPHQPMTNDSLSEQCRCVSKSCVRCLSAVPQLHLNFYSGSTASHFLMGGADTRQSRRTCSCSTEQEGGLNDVAAAPSEDTRRVSRGYCRKCGLVKLRERDEERTAAAECGGADPSVDHDTILLAVQHLPGGSPPPPSEGWYEVRLPSSGVGPLSSSRSVKAKEGTYAGKQHVSLNSNTEASPPRSKVGACGTCPQCASGEDCLKPEVSSSYEAVGCSKKGHKAKLKSPQCKTVSPSSCSSVDVCDQTNQPSTSSVLDGHEGVVRRDSEEKLSDSESLPLRSKAASESEHTSPNAHVQTSETFQSSTKEEGSSASPTRILSLTAHPTTDSLSSAGLKCAETAAGTLSCAHEIKANVKSSPSTNRKLEGEANAEIETGNRNGQSLDSLPAVDGSSSHSCSHDHVVKAKTSEDCSASSVTAGKAAADCDTEQGHENGDSKMDAAFLEGDTDCKEPSVKKPKLC